MVGAFCTRDSCASVEAPYQLQVPSVTELHCNLVVLLLHAAVSEKGKVCTARLGRDQVEGAFLPMYD